MSAFSLGVYRADGSVVEETAYLDDGRPVGLARQNASGWTVYPILTDHLGTPRQVLDPATGAPLWTWEAKEPFGNERPNETVSGTRFVYRGRFPGQVFDEDTGLVHNGFRDYLASVGRYAQSDPIGLGGGWNTYAYAAGNPLDHFDQNGLAVRSFKVDGNNVSVVLAMQYYGPWASENVVSKLNASIESMWTGTFGKYTVSMKVINGSDNLIYLSGECGTSLINADKSSGTWYRYNELGLFNIPNMAAHEAGHILGLPDRYTQRFEGGKRVTTPAPGFEHDIMADHRFGPEEIDIYEMIKANSK